VGDVVVNSEIAAMTPTGLRPVLSGDDPTYKEWTPQ
jgi:hypothetical protein